MLSAASKGAIASGISRVSATSTKISGSSMSWGWKKAKALRRPLLAAAATYFLKAKASSGLPADSVARFHLRNGARLERINFRADVSRQGLDQAHGLMTNYLYDLNQIEKNHEAFAAEGKLIAAAAVRKLMLHPIAARSRG